jgi:Protein of unknown function (DUF4233)
MKVMGSAILVFEAIVLGLSIPISVVVYDVSKTLTLWSTFLLMLLCILAIVVQAIIIGVGIYVRPLLFPGILFLLVWGLAYVMNNKVDEAKAARENL